MHGRRPKTKRNAPTISGDELRQALTTLEMTPDAFAARGRWHRSIVYRWIAAKQITLPPCTRRADAAPSMTGFTR